MGGSLAEGYVSLGACFLGLLGLPSVPASILMFLAVETTRRGSLHAALEVPLPDLRGKDWVAVSGVADAGLNAPLAVDDERPHAAEQPASVRG